VAGAPPYTIFLLSPANLAGERATLLFNPEASFPLARELRSPDGAPLGKVFSFVSGLYFHGKMTYALAFGQAPEGLSGALVISAGGGLRFLHERINLCTLEAWAGVSIDEHNRSFTEPLIAHATALDTAFGHAARIVLLGSVATNKYVKPLLGVFGERLLFPVEFVGRGDMSRGALLLAAAREAGELEYAPVAGAKRQGPRPARAFKKAAGPATPEVVIFVGLPGAGKSTFYRQRFGATHLHVSKDQLKQHRSERLQCELLRHALSVGQSVVVDNTNVSLAQRSEIIDEAKRQGARLIGYYFDSTVQECVNRNFGRKGAARVPVPAILSAAKRLRPPTQVEGFDELYTVRSLPGERFELSRAVNVRGSVA